jgi:hypothetical protein
MIEESDAYAILGTLEQGLADRGMLSRVGLCVAAAQMVARASAEKPRQPAGVS